MRFIGPRALQVFLLLSFSAAALAGQQPASSPTKSVEDPGVLVRAMVANELHACDTDRTLWRFADAKKDKGREELYEKVQTSHGLIERLVAIDGRPLDAQQRAAEDARLQRLANDPEEQRRHLREQREDAAKA